MAHPHSAPDGASIPVSSSETARHFDNQIDDPGLPSAMVRSEEKRTATVIQAESTSRGDATVRKDEPVPRASPRQRFRRWRRTRPFAAGLLTMLGGLIVLAGPLSLIRLAALPGSAIPIGIAVGSLIVLMGLFEWITPFYSLMAGAVTVVLSLVSLLTASFGGLLIGMLLSLTGGALAVAWRHPGSHAPGAGTQLPPSGPPAARS